MMQRVVVFGLFGWFFGSAIAFGQEVRFERAFLLSCYDGNPDRFRVQEIQPLFGRSLLTHLAVKVSPRSTNAGATARQVLSNFLAKAKNITLQRVHWRKAGDTQAV